MRRKTLGVRGAAGLMVVTAFAAGCGSKSSSPGDVYKQALQPLETQVKAAPPAGSTTPVADYAALQKAAQATRDKLGTYAGWPKDAKLSVANLERALLTLSRVKSAGGVASVLGVVRLDDQAARKALHLPAADPSALQLRS